MILTWWFGKCFPVTATKWCCGLSPSFNITWITTFTSYPIWFRALRSHRRKVLCVEREFCVVWFLLSDALVKWKVVQSTFLSARSHVTDPSSLVKGSSLEEVELEFLSSCKPFFVGKYLSAQPQTGNSILLQSAPASPLRCRQKETYPSSSLSRQLISLWQVEHSSERLTTDETNPTNCMSSNLFRFFFEGVGCSGH